jgi:hypothetical protein
MSKITKLIVLGLSFLIASFVILGGIGVKVRAKTNDDGSYRQLGVYSEVLSRIRTEYVEDPNIPAVTNGALHGLLESLDANSSYLDPTEYKDYKQRKEGKAGIGAAVSKRQRRHHRGHRRQVHTGDVAGRDRWPSFRTARLGGQCFRGASAARAADEGGAHARDGERSSR